MIEMEKTFLAKSIPKGLDKCECKDILDIYFPRYEDHAPFRLRKAGDTYTLTKKTTVEGEDKTHLHEQNISLSKQEFDYFANLIEGRRVHKTRYNYDYKGRTAEIDVFHDELEGLVVVDFEFDNKEEMDKFETPDFCLAFIGEEDFIAGGMLCGKKYDDIKEQLEKYGYKKLFLGSD